MSRRPERLPHALLQIPVMLLLSLGLGFPLLHGADLTHLIPQYLFISAVVSLFCGVFSLRKNLLPVSVFLLALLQGALYFFDAGFFRDTVSCVRIVQLYLGGADTALHLYGDILCTQLSVYLTLLCCMMSSPDNGLYPPIFCAGALLTMEWMLGLHTSSLYMLPVLPGLLLHYAATHRRENTDPDQKPRFVSPAALPVAALLLAAALALAPADGTKVEPFATLAQKLRDTIDDHFFFTEERARYTLASDGWMPLGQTQLGGAAQPSEREVMLVETDETTYLRGAILDTYTGGMWYDSVSARRYGWNAAHYRAIRDSLFEVDYPLISAQNEKEVTVTMLSDGASTLFTPQRIRELTFGNNMVGYFNTGTEVFITRNLAKDDQYRVRYLPMKATDSGMAALVQKNAQIEDPAYAELLPLYTQLPAHLQQEIFDIAAKATQSASTPWEKAVAIRDYLIGHYEYTLDVKTPPESVDFLAWFLLAEQKGYCTYFATAMTVLSRIAGLPARYVEGYIVKPDESGITLIRGVDAHAWTEVYLNGVGWVTFDATPSTLEPDRSSDPLPPAQEDSPTPTPEPEPEATPTPEPQSAPTPTPEPEEQPPQATPTPEPENESPPQENEPPEDPRRHPLPWLLLLLVIALILFLAARIRTTHPLYRAQKAANDTQALLILWEAALQCAACLHVARNEAETPLQFAQRAESQLGTRLEDIAQVVSAIRYGRHNAPEEALHRVRSVYQSLEERLSLWHKFKLSFRRAFTVRKNA